MDLLTALTLLTASAFLSFLFSGIEAGFLALNPVRIRRLARSGNRAARSLKKHLDDPDPFLWTILVGNTVANLSFVALAVFLFQGLGQFPIAIVVLLYGMTFFVFYTFLDLLPKMLVRRFPNRLTILLTYPFGLFFALLAPFAKMISTLKLTSRSEPTRPSNTGAPFQNRDDLRRVMQESGSNLRSDERSLIERVMELQDQSVFSLMNPFNPELSVSPQHSLQATKEVCKRHARSRILVRDTKRNRKTTLGVFHLKKALFSQAHNSNASVTAFTTPAFTLKHETALDDALHQMKAAGERLAIVLDKDQKEIGVISLNDILRKIFTDIEL